MHVRFSTLRGMLVIEEEEGYALARVSDVLIHPETGRIEGFFVRTGGAFMAENLFLSVHDILRIGLVITVRDSERLAPPEDVLRVMSIVDEKCPVIGQRIVTKNTKRVLGTCMDVQFDTVTFMLEWLFPRKWFRLQTPLPASEILEVTPEAIIVREPEIKIEETKKAPVEHMALTEALQVAAGTPSS